MNKLICLLCICYCCNLSAQTTLEKPRILYGICTKDSLAAKPFNEWYQPNHDLYRPAASVISALKKEDFSPYSVRIFFGSWCGDSKREVPRFLKLLSEISFPDKKIQLVGLGAGDSLYKQSPQHEEAGLGIYRVPTFIIYKNGVEVNRINEYPVLSLEKDFRAILQSQPYTPNYHSFPAVKKWIGDGTLLDENTSIRGLAEQLRFAVGTENELNSLGYLLLKQGKKKESLKIFQVNYQLFPESANIASSLGEGYLENEDYKKAVAALERSLEINKDPAALKEILTLLYKAKAKE